MARAGASPVLRSRRPRRGPATRVPSSPRLSTRTRLPAAGGAAGRDGAGGSGGAAQRTGPGSRGGGSGEGRAVDRRALQFAGRAGGDPFAGPVAGRFHERPRTGPQVLDDLLDEGPRRLDLPPSHPGSKALARGLFLLLERPPRPAPAPRVRPRAGGGPPPARRSVRWTFTLRHVALDAGEVLGELRLGGRCAGRVRRRRWREERLAARRDLERQTPSGRAGTSADRSAHRSPDRIRSRRQATPSVVEAYDFSMSSWVVAATRAPRRRK